MQSKRRFGISLLLMVLVFGILAGHSLTHKVVTQPWDYRREMAAIQGARGAMDMIQLDLQQAGYAPTLPPPATGARPAAELAVATASNEGLSLRAPDGHWTTYRMEGHKLVRITSKDYQVVLESVRDFQVRPADEGQAINVAFWIPMGDGQAPMYAHFVRASE